MRTASCQRRRHGRIVISVALAVAILEFRAFCTRRRLPAVPAFRKLDA